VEKVILGLGNPGPEYALTRHNVGWWLLDHLAHRWAFPVFERHGPAWVSSGTIEGVSVLLIRPDTYMNRSGDALVLVPSGLDVSQDLLVLVDDVTRPPGGLRLRPHGSPGGHNGLRSIDRALGHGDYARLRLGVGAPPPGVDLAEWVLSCLPPDDEERVQDLLDDAGQGVALWIREGAQVAMNRINR